MKTVKVDSKRRIVLPGAQKGQVFRVENPAEGVFRLVQQVDLKPTKKTGPSSEGENRFSSKS